MLRVVDVGTDPALYVQTSSLLAGEDPVGRRTGPVMT